MTRRLSVPLGAALFLLLLASGAFAAPLETVEPLKTACFPSLESAIRIKGPIDFCGERVPLDQPGVRERLEKELLLMLWDRAQVILWLKRTGRYFPYIQSVLAEADMPDDLKYVAVIESALRPHAGSSKGARGIWQFIPTTGRKYGLQVNRSVDERRNFHFATTAALKYLAELREQFGSWTLACAGYNMGENGLEKAVEKQEVDDYYNLHLPRETQRYVLRALAAKLILADPARYGFDMRPEDYYQPVPYDRVKLTTRQSAPITVIAKAANTYYKTIKDLNPQLLGETVPRGEHILFLPKDSAGTFSQKYLPLIAKHRKEHGPKTYVVRSGDSLTNIARRHNLSLWQLCKLNKLSTRATIHPGQRLVVGH